MTQQLINVGTAPNDGTGDFLRPAFQKANANFTELYTRAPLLTAGSVVFVGPGGVLAQDNANLFWDDTRDALGVGAASSGNAKLRVSGSSAGSGGFGYGTLVDQIVRSVDNTEVASFISVTNTQATPFTLSAQIGFKAQQNVIGISSAITTQIGFKVDSSLIGGAANIGFDSEIPAGTNRWNFYAPGTADNYMAGRLGIGTTSISTTKLRIFWNATGGTNLVGINHDAVVQSDVTAGYSGYSTNINTQAASFNCGALAHYNTFQGGLGAGSSIGTQVGFWASTSLVGAVNNYGFYSDLPAGTGRWNFFANGTAQNAFLGNVRIGSLAAPAVALDVVGAIQSTSYVMGNRVVAIGNPTVDWGLDFAPSQTIPNFIALANNATFDLPYGAGFLMLFDNAGGGAGMFMCVYGGVSIMVQNAADFTVVAGTAGKLNVYYNAGTNRYRVQNMKGSTSNLFVGSIRMRDNP